MHSPVIFILQAERETVINKLNPGQPWTAMATNSVREKSKYLNLVTSEKNIYHPKPLNLLQSSVMRSSVHTTITTGIFASNLADTVKLY